MEDIISIFKTKITSHYNEAQANLIFTALEDAINFHEGQKRASGEPYVIHPIKVAEFLCDLNMDHQVIIAGLLHDVLEDTHATYEQLQTKYGTQVADLVNGVTKISSVTPQKKLVQSTQTIRKMLFAMSEDIRVILIKLADRYHNMKTLDHLPPEKQLAKAHESLEIYAPLAQRLGISWMKAELEDIALKYINFTAYHHIVENLALRQNKREAFLKKVSEILALQGEKENLNFEIQTRAKHIYSIYMKMKKLKKDMDEMFDLNGVRLICKTIPECYTILGMVHALWPPIEGRFKDYIAMPKANLYQSLHTTVMSIDGQLLEVQIRTRDMHLQAEYGIAAHWLYKNELSHINSDKQELMIINKLKGWSLQERDAKDFLHEIKEELLRDSIYVFTPAGQIIELPKGATPLDFAYYIHTEVGNHFIGARSQNGMLSIKSTLQNTDIVEILTSKSAHPHFNWLRIARTPRARNKIRYWLAHNDKQLNSTLATKKAKPTNSTQPKDEDKSTAIKKQSDVVPTQTLAPISNLPSTQSYSDNARLKIKVGDEKNMMIKMAGCCHPSPGDPILGYVSRGRGIIIHLKECNNLAHISDLNERSINVEWDTSQPRETFRLTVLSKKIPDLFSQVDNSIRKLNGHLIQGRVEEIPNGNLSATFLVELANGANLTKLKRSIKNIPAILNIEV